MQRGNRIPHMCIIITRMQHTKEKQQWTLFQSSDAACCAHKLHVNTLRTSKWSCHFDAFLIWLRKRKTYLFYLTGLHLKSSRHFELACLSPAVSRECYFIMFCLVLRARPGLTAHTECYCLTSTDHFDYFLWHLQKCNSTPWYLIPNYSHGAE